MPTRLLTIGERAILKFVFGDTLIAYSRITTNDANRGGEDNSITYADIPHYSKKIWCPDFSAATAETWTFVHEFGHVWQFRYATHPVSGWLQNVMRHPVSYELNYYYDLMKSDDFYDYNIEQQASMVADYWAVSVSRERSIAPIQNRHSARTILILFHRFKIQLALRRRSRSPHFDTNRGPFAHTSRYGRLAVSGHQFAAAT